MTTPYHSQYWAHALTLQGAVGNVANLARSIANARVELKPHQVDAALFALRSPFSQGAILADEVGLGKTIEASIVIAQRWAERRRRILLVVPATLRTQWQQELAEKFYLPAIVLDSKQAKDARKAGIDNPFEQGDQIIICSYHYASARKREVSRVPWDLVVIDEAHRLRNVYQKSSRLARNLADALNNRPKLLLTATPLQNSLVELFGLVSIIDPHFFGDLRSFRAQYVYANDEAVRNRNLSTRLAKICQRTLRKQVFAYVPFTKRQPLTWEFHASDDEFSLYELVSEYLRQDDLIALPSSQRKLLTLVLRKLLASSTFAIAGTLNRLVARLEELQRAKEQLQPVDDLVDDYSGFSEVADEYEAQEEADATDDAETAAIAQEVLDRAATIDPVQLAKELSELRSFAQMAAEITVNAKGERLLASLESALHEASKLGAARKAVIFTESRRTQQYLYDLLTNHGYGGKVVLINGVNDDARSRQLYQAWQQRHQGADRVTGSQAVDLKTALIDYFRDAAEILIATEAAAEGVNLQFCSLVINYDLPWNPQRIEQRIGRCHRYGQKHDVLVVNFVNLRNAADKRVYQLLHEKFRLFDGIFGASDEVLGALVLLRDTN
jgi:adenine-specific DNA-methyltransferase